MLARQGPSLLGRSLRPATHAAAPCTQARHVHFALRLRPELEEGATPFLSKEAIQVAGSQWQQGLLNRLNDEVRNTDLETLSVARTVLQTAQDRYKAQTFNFASLALNNSFFFSNLRPEPRMADEGSAPSNDLKKAIDQTFGSKADLQKAVKAVADGMTTTGWIWLASDVAGNVGIIPTHGAGTILTPFRAQAGNIDARLSMEKALTYAFPPASEPSSEKNASNETQESPQAQDDSLTEFQHLAKYTPFTYPPELRHHRHQRPITPLFNISLQEHAWALDYGVWGRDQYLDNFWKCLDWTEPNRAYQRVLRELLKV